MGQVQMQRSGAQSNQYVILVGNLPYWCKWQDLKDLVRGYTKAVERTEVYLTEDGRSRGFGFIVVKGKEEALRVSRKLNGHEWKGRALMAMIGNEHGACPIGANSQGWDNRRGKSVPSTSSTPEPSPTPELSTTPERSTTPDSSQRTSHQPQGAAQFQFFPPPPPYQAEYGMWTYFSDPYGLSPLPTPQYLQQIPYGGPYVHPMPYPPMAVGATNCYGQPVYSSVCGWDYPPPPQSAPYHPDGFPVYIDHSQPYIPPTPHVVVPITGDGLPVNLSKGAVVTEPRGLHVGNLPYDLTAEDLRRHLKNAGTIVLCEVPKGSNGKGKGYGIVLFKTVEEADCCIALFNKSILKGREINVRRDKFATRKFNVESA